MRNDIVQRRQVNLVNVLMVTHPPRTAKDASHSTIADLPAPERERLRLQIAGIVERDVYPEWRNAIALLETLLPRTTGDAGMFEASEVERYVVNPGQACSYMIGQLKILELRDKARSALGSRFSERAFHDAVLGAGILPLTLLEREVDGYVQAARR